MNETERLLLDIETRMLKRRDVDDVLAHLNAIQKNLNTCIWALTFIGAIVFAFAIRFL